MQKRSHHAYFRAFFWILSPTKCSASLAAASRVSFRNTAVILGLRNVQELNKHDFLRKKHADVAELRKNKPAKPHTDKSESNHCNIPRFLQLALNETLLSYLYLISYLVRSQHSKKDNGTISWHVLVLFLTAGDSQSFCQASKQETRWNCEWKIMANK